MRFLVLASGYGQTIKKARVCLPEQPGKNSTANPWTHSRLPDSHKSDVHFGHPPCGRERNLSLAGSTTACLMRSRFQV